jgi:hypothetical protein
LRLEHLLQHRCRDALQAQRRDARPLKCDVRHLPCRPYGRAAVLRLSGEHQLSPTMARCRTLLP